MATVTQPRIGDIVRRRLSKALEALGVAAPGVVVSAAADGLTATVRIGTNRRVPAAEVDGDDSTEEFSPVQSVPVVWPQGRGIWIDPADMLQPGDPVLLVCLDRDASSWRSSGEVSDPGDARLHDWSNAVAIPGLLPDSSPFSAITDGPGLASAIATELANIALAMDTIAAAVPVSNSYPATGNTAPLIKARILSDRLRLDK
jgi:hypothetical protein